MNWIYAPFQIPRGGIMKVDNPFDFDSDPFHQYLGLTLEETREDYARIRLNIHANTPTGIGGSVNGGVLSTMIDMAAVPAVFTNIRAGSEPAGTAASSAGSMTPHGGASRSLCQRLRRSRP